jgi:trk system potassium uptake protein TrkH
MNNSSIFPRPANRFTSLSNIILQIFSSIGLILVIIQSGYQWQLPNALNRVFFILELLLLLSYLANVVIHFIDARSDDAIPKISTLDVVILFAIFFFSINISTMTILIIARQLISWGQKTARTPIFQHLLSVLLTNPATLTMYSFLVVILLGTILLTLPAATRNGEGATLLTALFTATSATCVTGLTVVDTGSFFSTFGQVVIVCLIQIGGLGIMTLSSSLALIFGRRFGIREQATLQDIFDIPDAQTLKKIIIYVIKLTFWVELAGAIILYFQFADLYQSFYRTLFSAIFHSVAAFCNAGFSLFPDNFVRFQTDWIINLTIAGLIVIGGIGFTVIANVVDPRNFKHGFKHFFHYFSLHTKIVIIVTFLLISVGTLIIFFFEFDNALLQLPVRYKLLAAFFQSISLRTAGFNTIDFGHLKNITIFMMLIWMFIGAAPGSTGGGIKVSTFGVAILTLKTIFSGRHEAEAFQRMIPQNLVYKSIAIIMISIILLSFGFSLLAASEHSDFATLIFECTSAFGTVGLSLGITPLLSSYGRIIIIFLMYIGRIGPLTLAYAIGEKTQRLNVKFPNGKIMVG